MISILNVSISSTSYIKATNLIRNWVNNSESRYVCAANVHMLMEAYDSKKFREIITSADMVTPDGIPLVWMMRLKGENKQGRVYGPDLMLSILEMAQENKISVGFFGSSPLVLEELKKHLYLRYPELIIDFAYSPPYRDLCHEEENRILQKIKKSQIRILFVGLGCPKQEVWMSAHKGKIPAVMIGVGAAFDIHSGLKPQAPPMMQKLGLEWIFRLIHEPKRLWKRYLFHNPRFIVLAFADLLGFLPTD